MKKYVRDEINYVLPMKYPYMILDSLHVEEGEWAESIIDLKEDEWFFKCHFPNNPILPGFLLLESMGQTLLATFIQKAELPEGQVPLMAAVKEIHFDGFCVPGDRVIIRAELKRFKYGVAKGRVVAYKNEMTTTKILADVGFEFILPIVLQV